MSINFLDPKVNPFQTSEIRRIQDFYWVDYLDLDNATKLKSLWLKEEEIKYCLENKDKEFALKSTEWFELREGVTTTERFKKIQDFYWFSLKDTQDVEKLKSYWVSIEDIEFITWKILNEIKVKKWKKSDI